MRLIADSGSTKTHWVLLNGEQERHCVTEGLNPWMADRGVFAMVGRQLCGQLGLEGARVEQMFFYGAGCGTESACQRVREWMGETLPFDSMEVNSDLLGACRATCGSNEGMVGILGTGSNMCYYNGQRVALQRVSTGFILGDEGSGNHIGKRLLKDYLEERMPEDLRVMFHDDYPYTTAEFIDCIYRRPFPNRFLASLASFAASHKENQYMQEVIRSCFRAYFEQMSYFGEHASLPLHVVGGLVSSFEAEIGEAAAGSGVRLGVMVQSPIEGLVSFHKE